MNLPVPDIENGPLSAMWQAAQKGIWRLPRCGACGRIDWYPNGTCRECGSDDIAWTELSGRACLFSWAIVRRALDPRLAPLVPYVSAIVTPVEDPKARFVTRLVDVEPELLRMDMFLIARFLDLGHPEASTGIIAPLFAPDRDACAYSVTSIT